MNCSSTGSQHTMTQTFSSLRTGLAGLLFCLAIMAGPSDAAAQLLEGVAKVDITNTEAGLVNDPLYVKALVLKSGTTTMAIVTVDAVAIGEIGYIKNDYLGKVRSLIEKQLHIKPANVLVNASHCHGIVCSDVDQPPVQAVKAAAENLVPVKAGVGVGHEDRIMENRRLKLKSGRTVDVRHAYSLPPDDEVAQVGLAWTRRSPVAVDQRIPTSKRE